MLNNSVSGTGVGVGGTVGVGGGVAVGHGVGVGSVVGVDAAAGPTFDVAPGERGGLTAAQVATTAQSAADRTAASGGRCTVVRRWLAD